MKKLWMGVALGLALVALGVAIVVPSDARAEVVSATRVWTAQATNTTVFVPTPGGTEAQVTVIGNSSPDGTVTISTCPNRDTDGCVVVATYATPSAAKTYAGTSSAQLYITLTGNTTGNVDLYVVLKK